MDIGSIDRGVPPNRLADRVPLKAQEAQSGRESHMAPQEEKLGKACADFEAILLDRMFQAMRSTLPKDGIFGGSHQQDMFESMYYQELATRLAREKSIGIGEALFRQLRGQD